MTAAPTPAAGTVEQARAWIGCDLVTVDLVWRGKDYRIEEPYRSGGASVRLWDQPLDGGCSECGLKIRRASKYLRITPHCVAHPACAIRSGFLVHLDGHERARLAGIAWG